ncbi:TetR/AcrR family transcriptional regulator [Clostridium sp. AF15-17LB]|nr:TetR/AcrR family transcriptional regulator [Clostridium sp. AF15-17LB]
MPRQRLTKDMVVKAAFDLAREGGLENVTVKGISQKLDCSVQPVYCYCRNMSGLKQDVIDYTGSYLQSFINERLDVNDMFQSMGMAHAQFAKAEPHLYRLYFLRKRDDVHSFEDIYKKETDPQIAEFIARQLGITIEKARQLHLNMLIYNTGISFILTALGSDTDIGRVHDLLTQAKDIFTHSIIADSKQEEPNENNRTL